MKKTIDNILENAVQTGEAVGSSCHVYLGGEQIYSGAAGYADREAGKVMADNAVFRLFSLTKPVTSAAAMILIDRKVFSPEDPVSKYFPEYAKLSYVTEDNSVIPCDTEMKLSHLLNMTSGLPYANDWGVSVCAAGRLFDAIIEGQATGNDLTTEEICRRAAEIPLMFKPGERWEYGISADIMGGIIEKASGMRYGEFLRKNIFEPLGMNDTGFFVPEEKLDRFTALYSWQENGLGRDFGKYLGLTDYTKPPAFESGGAGLVSTIEDYSKFACMLANHGEYNGVRLFSEETFGYMASPKLSDIQRKGMWDRLEGYNYSCFMRVHEKPEISVSSTGKGEIGWDGWTGTFFAADPERNVAILYFTQICGAGTTKQALDICEAVYKNI